MKVSILLGTYGDERWRELSRQRALPSTENQDAYEVLARHEKAGTVSTVRNALARKAKGTHLLFLDADDELEPGFVAAMAKARESSSGKRDRKLLTPQVAYVVNGVKRKPKFWPVIPFERGNWVVIGTVCPRDIFFEAGGFRDWGDPPGSNAYEDYALWAQISKLDVEIVKVPDAIYVAHIERGSRHRHSDHMTRLEWHYEIGQDLFPDIYTEAWWTKHVRRVPKRLRRK